MDVDTALRTIQKHQQVFAFGIVGVHTLVGRQIEFTEPMRPLRTNIAEDLVHAGFHVAQTVMSPPLEQATANRLGMQLVVGVGDIIKAYTKTHPEQHEESWADHPHPEVRFLRQIRNGAAHDNRLDFSKSPLRSGTHWRGCELSKDMDGIPVFTDIPEVVWGTQNVTMEDGLLEAGDALALSIDIIEKFLPKSEVLGPGNFIGLAKNPQGGMTYS